MSSSIRLDRVVRSYGALRALDGVSAELPGGAMGLLGPNGAGKTTLLKVLLALLPADEGRAEILGLDPCEHPLEIRARTGYMPESDCFIPRLTGVRLVSFAGELAGLPRREALTRAHEVLHYVGLGEVRYRPAEGYSQGLRQRLRLAQALVHDPELLFLDEPTSGLDPAGRREMLDLVRDLAERHGKHVVLSTHLLPDVEEVCTHVMVLDRGRVAACGPLAELRGRQEGRFRVRVAGDRAALIERLAADGHSAEPVDGDRLNVGLAEGTRPLFAAALAAGVQIRELAEVTLTLEESLVGVLGHAGEDT